MKKSTLITTIAMIVVVVVALSTATYAWFASSSTAVATVQMQTTASAEWLLYEGVEGSTNVYTFPEASSSVALTNTLSNGLFSPINATKQTLTIAGTTATAGQRGFFAADDNDKVITAGEDYKPNVIKVSSAFASGSTKTLRLSIIVNAKSVSSNAALYAASQLSFSIYQSKNGATATEITNGYKVATFANNAAASEATVEPAAEAATAVEGVATGVTTGLKNGKDDSAITAKITYANAAQKDGSGDYVNWSKCTLANPDKGLAVNNIYFEYYYDFTGMTSTDSIYFSIFTWIDGWDVDLSAANASFDVTYAFTTAPAQG